MCKKLIVSVTLVFMCIVGAFVVPTFAAKYHGHTKMTEAYVINLDGSNGESLMTPPTTNIEVALGETEVIDASFLLPQIAKGLNGGLSALLGGGSEPGLVSYYDFEEIITKVRGPSTKESILDSVGGNDGKVINGAIVVYDEESQGNVLSLDGVDDYITAKGVAKDLDSFPFTISAWVQPKGISRGSPFSLGTDLRSGNSFFWAQDGSTPKYSHYSSGGGYATSTNTFNDYEWHHVAWVIDENGNGVIYVNGNSEATWSNSDSNIKSFIMGRELRSPDYTDDSALFFSGLIDDLKVWNYDLSEEEVIEDYGYLDDCAGPDDDSSITMQIYNMGSATTNSWMFFQTGPDYNEGYDGGDIIYGSPMGDSFMIFSSPLNHPLGDLFNDQRPSNTPGIDVHLGYDGSGLISGSNQLGFKINSVAGFEDKKIIAYDINNPSTTYPVDKTLDSTTTIDLPDLVNQSEGTYATWAIRFECE